METDRAIAKALRRATEETLATERVATDPRVLAAAKALHKRANPGPGYPWSKSDRQWRWLSDARVAIEAADKADPLRAPAAGKADGYLVKVRFDGKEVAQGRVRLPKPPDVASIAGGFSFEVEIPPEERAAFDGLCDMAEERRYLAIEAVGRVLKRQAGRIVDADTGEIEAEAMDEVHDALALLIRANSDVASLLGTVVAECGQGRDA